MLLYAKTKSVIKVPVVGVAVSRLVVKLHSLYRCRLVRRTPYACSPAVDGSVLL